MAIVKLYQINELFMCPTSIISQINSYFYFFRGESSGNGISLQIYPSPYINVHFTCKAILR